MFFFWVIIMLKGDALQQFQVLHSVGESDGGSLLLSWYTVVLADSIYYDLLICQIESAISHFKLIGIDRFYYTSQKYV